MISIEIVGEEQISCLGPQISPEVMGNMLGFLPPKELTNVACINQRMNAFTKYNSLWKTHYLRDFPEMKDDDNSNTKAGYLRQHELHVAEQVRLKIQREEQQERDRIQRRRRRFSKLLHAFQESFLYCVIPGLVIVFTVLAVAALQSQQVISWAHASPLLIVIGLITVGVCTMCYARSAVSPIPFDDRAYDDDSGPLKEIMDEIGDDNFLGQSLGLWLFVVCTLQAIFFILKITTAVNWSWVEVSIPLWIAFFSTCCCLPFAKCVNDVWIPVIFTSCLVTPIMVTVLLLVLRLDGETHLLLVYAFIPLYLLELVASCAICGFAIDEDDGGSRLGMCCGWLCLIAPLIAFEVLISLLVDFHSSALTFWTAFIPMFIFQGAVAILGCGACFEYSSWYK